MFDLGWGEMLIVGVVALIVVGPKELPGLFRAIGQFVGRARGMAREFSRAMEAAADESGVRDIEKTIRAAARPMQTGADRLREAALGKPAASKLPPAGTSLGAVKPGGATEALAASRAAERERLHDEAEARAADAERRAADAERRAVEAERRAAAAAAPDGPA